MKNKESELIPIALFIIFAIVSFWDVVVVNSGIIRGDYIQQFVPWYTIYAECLKHYTLPLWTRYIQCGFPMFAEGQIGALYPLNILFFAFLPFKIAYNYSFLLHFILAGIFMYIYARKIQTGIWGSFLATIILCFGNVYAGAFVNISTLKSLCFFPLVLFIYEKYVEPERKNTGHFFLIGAIWGTQLLTGSYQMTCYSIFFCLVYFLYRNYIEKQKVALLLKNIAVAGLIAFLISLPQVYATLQLSQYTNRANQTLDFALWDSFSPLALAGAIFPYFASIFTRGNVMYVSLLGLFFAFVSLRLVKEDKFKKAALLLFGLALFFAIGKYNPLYTGVLRLFRFYSFRAPSRFMYFACFALSILSARGFNHIFSEDFKNIPKKTYGIFTAISVFVVCMFLSVKAALRYFAPQIIRIAKAYAANNIYGKPFHRYSLNTYMVKVENIFDSLQSRLLFINPSIIYGLLLIVITLLLIHYLMPRRMNHYIKYICLGFICLDLSVLSFYFGGPRTSIAQFKELDVKQGKIFNILKEDKSIYRIYPFGAKNKLPHWSYFNTNMAYGIDSIGIYSPLAGRDYYAKVKGLGVVDDSLGIVPAEKEVISQNRELLQTLNVKYILSTEELDNSFLTRLAEERGIYLYKFKDALPRFILLLSTSHGDINSQDVDIHIEEYASGFAKVTLKSKIEDFLVFLESFYPGWQCYIDGKKTKILKFADIFQAIKVLPGSHTIIFKYQPFYLKIFLPISSAVFLISLLYGLYSVTKKTVIPT